MPIDHLPRHWQPPLERLRAVLLTERLDRLIEHRDLEVQAARDGLPAYAGPTTADVEE